MFSTEIVKKNNGKHEVKYKIIMFDLTYAVPTNRSANNIIMHRNNTFISEDYAEASEVKFGHVL